MELLLGFQFGGIITTVPIFEDIVINFSFPFCLHHHKEERKTSMLIINLYVMAWNSDVI